MQFVSRIRRRDLLAASLPPGPPRFPFPAIGQQKSPNEKLSIAGICGEAKGRPTSATAAGEEYRRPVRR